MTKKAFSPIQVGRHQLQHRIVLAPLTRFRATQQEVPTQLQVDYYTQRASPGGLLITEATYISNTAGGYRQAPGIYSPQQIEAWKRVTASVHQTKGAVIFMQLWHLGRVGSSHRNPNKERVVSASDIPMPGLKPNGRPYEVPRPLETEEVKQLVQTYRQAALNAIEAGFDGVEVHSANGYLLDQFINSGTNKRTDEYGGSIENRTRFPLEVMDAIADAIGPDRTAIRFSPNGAVQGMQDDSPTETWGYLTQEIQRRHPNLAYLHFIESRSDFNNERKVNTVDTLDHYREIWKGPFISAGGYSNTVEHAVEIAERTGNLIAFGRAFIANPDLPERIKQRYRFNPYDRKTFYTHDAIGYTDYPFYDASPNQSRL